MTTASSSPEQEVLADSVERVIFHNVDRQRSNAPISALTPGVQHVKQRDRLSDNLLAGLGRLC